MENEPLSKKRQLFVTLAVLIVIVVIVGGVVLSNKDKGGDATNTSATASDASAATGSPANASDTPTETDAEATSSYKDGNYSATGKYTSPGGGQEVTISVTLKDGVVTGTSAQSGANDAEGREYQGQFIAGYKSEVVGRSIDSIKLNRVSGSSLTSQGFNDAIETIKSQAKS